MGAGHQHALLVLGIPITQKDANKATKVPSIVTRLRGTDTPELKRGLKYFGCEAVEHSFWDPEKLRGELDSLLASGCPAILAVEYGNHWVVIPGKDARGRYYWIDSNDDEFIGCWGWDDIVEWIDSQEYYLIGVKPKNGSQIRHSLVPRWSEVYRLLDDDDLCEYWGYYLEDLNEIFDSPSDGTDSLTAEQFFNEYGKSIFDAACYYYAYADIDTMKWEMGNYKKVASAHRLTLSTSRIPEAMASFAAALTCIACIS